jgi:hypothetical protein
VAEFCRRKQEEIDLDKERLEQWHAGSADAPTS